MRLLILTLLLVPSLAGTPLPQFRYQTIHISLCDLSGKPVPSAYVYGYCKDLNLLWPRSDVREMLYEQSPLGHPQLTEVLGNDGQITAKVPLSHWNFMAVGSNGRIVRAWQEVVVGNV